MSEQHDWTSCPRCQGLFYGPFKGRCPTGGEHETTNSFNYTMLFDVQSTANVQTGWASCPRCQGMHFAGFPEKGVCPAGGPHVQDNSFAYALSHDLPPSEGTQAEWRSCPKCLGLFYGPFKGRCPADGLEHSAAGSFNYSLTILARKFARPAISMHALQGEDRGRFVEVVGNAFTPKSLVELSYGLFYVTDGVKTSQTSHESLSSDGEGSFQFSIPNSGGAITGGSAEAIDVASNDKADAELPAP
jgi:hypothetical protein